VWYTVEHDFFIQKFTKMKPLYVPPDRRPGHFGFQLSDAHQKQRQPTNQLMGANAIVLRVAKGPQRQAAFKRPEGTLHFEELVAQGNVFGSPSWLPAAVRKSISTS